MQPVSINDQDQADLKLLNSLAATHYLYGRHQKAMNILRLALWVDVKNVKTLEMTAVVAWRLGQVNRAKAAVKLLEAIDADVPEAIKFITMLYARD